MQETWESVRERRKVVRKKKKTAKYQVYVDSTWAVFELVKLFRLTRRTPQHAPLQALTMTTKRPGKAKVMRKRIEGCFAGMYADVDGTIPPRPVFFGRRMGGFLSIDDAWNLRRSSRICIAVCSNRKVQRKQQSNSQSSYQAFSQANYHIFSIYHLLSQLWRRQQKFSNMMRRREVVHAKITFSWAIQGWLSPFLRQIIRYYSSRCNESIIELEKLRKVHQRRQIRARHGGHAWEQGRTDERKRKRSRFQYWVYIRNSTR